MEKVTVDLSKPIDYQLRRIQAPFFEISKEQFQEYQRNAEKKLRSLIYRTADIELANGNSEVTFYNLCYTKEKPKTRYFLSVTTFTIPPWNFLGDEEEIKIIRCLSGDKGRFLRQCRRSMQNMVPSTTAATSLTAQEKREVQECMKIFENDLIAHEMDTIEGEDSACDHELPNFSLNFDFLTNC